MLACLYAVISYLKSRLVSQPVLLQCSHFHLEQRRCSTKSILSQWSKTALCLVLLTVKEKEKDTNTQAVPRTDPIFISVKNV
jgi:hypothetical protein